MKDYNLNLDLLKCHKSFIYQFNAKDGTRKPCICIPANENFIALKTDSNGYDHAYLNLSVWERTDRDTGQPAHDQWGNSHSVQLQIPKEERDKMNADERKAAAVYLGSAKPMRQPAPAPAQNTAAIGQSDGGDLPF